MKKILCFFFGHKPKKGKPLSYFINGEIVLSTNVPIFCDRCGAGELDMIIDNMIKSV